MALSRASRPLQRLSHHTRRLHTSTSLHLPTDIEEAETLPPAPQSHQTSPFALYTHGLPPSKAQLAHATTFFARSKRTFLLSTPRFKTLPPSPLPEVAFVGRSNVGKSSMLNAVLGGDGGRGGSGSVGGGGGRSSLARESKHARRTRTLCAFGVGDVRVVHGGINAESKMGAGLDMGGGEKKFERWEASAPSVVMLDTPGYGTHTPADWGKQMFKYLQARKQLRRTFVLVDIEHGLKDTDKMMLRLLRTEAVPHQLIVCKIDKILLPSPKSRAKPSLDRLPAVTKRMAELVAEAAEHGGPSLLRDPLGCSTTFAYPKATGALMGVEDIRAAVLAATGLNSDFQGVFKRRPDFLAEDLQLPAGGSAASA